ncbi:uncharacterized protein LOC129575071 isoform X2 [Sitodiplosis mosellana]|uniref:uncharacterized protein LOC129575071 isoform X2 n=1 Tax=Sitodiplosis mosellana TaxID=263140 RepID=UPI002443BD09|nr:uncharacterized protein LOC129575071 isoform X2 [Sitodiplosis mosellana]XP_055313902.1 uncharacterized protein LOC129575071 isoform X2 [Sitodiplosis mosellana]XP_055313903.1 uncharacterized protein LOC129575071 isoform X2 [Sitodiplosis mosellana]XP_055313904.1 uncharacterized protein LOC129575071 isoform X2 [Sitodiplosis mosellana]XP_055313905.1 uncharacterized protein LOC129575071 isoform X2 [Sitodiplosis mosellana]
MGKGTKKKTVWRTFSFENGYTNDTNDADTNGLTASHHQKNGLDNDVSSRSSISNGKIVANWRTERRYSSSGGDDENDGEPKYHIDSNGNVNGCTENGHRAFYKRTPLADKYPLRGNGLRKAPSHFQENGNKTDFHDIHDNQAMMKSSQFRSSRLTKVPVTDSRHASHKKWDGRNDEYTRISTPRSEVLFKKGYLMRDKKYVGPTNTMSTTATTSSNDSGSVSVVSNEETASYYSIQSMSPDNSTYLNGNNSSDSTSATYPNDGFEHDLSLIYSSGFYDNNGYFYVNPYIHNNFDQFNGPTILMPYGTAPNTKDVDDYDADAFPPAPMSPGTGDAKSIDEEHANNYNSINSEDMSNSSLSENVSINNDLDTPMNPLTPPPSPLSPNEKPIARSEAPESDKPTDETSIETKIENETDTQIETQDGQKITETLSDEQDELPEAEGDAVVSDNYSMPYFSPFIFVPPIPFVPDARMAGSRRGKFRHHTSNHFGRPKRNNRFSHFYNKVYIPTNWSEAPDEMSQNNTNEEEVVEPKLGEENAFENAPTPTIEQCDTILKTSKLNLNVSEFIPQSKRMIFVPLPITPSPPASVYFVPIPSTESTLNVNVPEFLPKNYKPVNAEGDDGEIGDEAPVSVAPPSKITTTTTTTTAMTANITTKMTTITNESAKNQNETTNIHTNGLNTDTKCAAQPAATLDNQHVTNGVHTIASNATKNEKNNNNHHHKSQPDYVAAIKQNGVTVSIMSDLLKTNSDNLNLDACSFNNENSHTNLKADLGNKKITNNISKNKVYKNDNYCNDSGSSKSTKIMNSNKNAKARHAYPKTKETPQDKPCDSLTTTTKTSTAAAVASKSSDQLGRDAGVESSPKLTDDGKVSEKMIEKAGLTYAQMVVPTKLTDVKTTPEMTDAKVAHEPKAATSVKVELECSKLSKSSMKNGKHPQQHNRKSHANKKKPVPANRNERPKPIEGPVEWYTVGAKGKKHVAPNGSTVAEIAFENESKVERVNKIAEELQLDIKKDADLAMDIMDSLTISEERADEDVTVKAPRKKKTTVKPKKKLTKDKVHKEQKRRATFDIIEPNFESPKNESQSTEETTTAQEEEIASEHNVDSVEPDEKDATESSLDSFVFDPNVFATPCNLQIDSLQRSAGGKLGNSLRLSTGKPVRNLINTFDIYQQDFTSVENQQLKQEEEMVIKILQQLNKSFDGKDTPQKDDKLVEIVPDVLHVETESMTVHQDTMAARENSVERFAINAKPYQNVYSSNHFLEHFFGDRNDKCDQFVISTDLSSSDQSYVEEYVDDDMPANLNTYPAIGNEEESIANENGQTEIEQKLHANGFECEGKSIEREIESASESITDDIEKNECEEHAYENETAEQSIQNGIERNDECIEIQPESIKSETGEENELNQIEIKSQSEIEQNIDESKEDLLNITKALEQILQRRSEVESKVEEKLQHGTQEAASVVQSQESQKLEQKKMEAQKSDEEIEKLDVSIGSQQTVEDNENVPEVQIEKKFDGEHLTETQSDTIDVLEQKTETQVFEVAENEDSIKPIEDTSTESITMSKVNVPSEELNGDPAQSFGNKSTESNCNEPVCHDRESVSFEEIQNEANESIYDNQIELNLHETVSVSREMESISPATVLSCHEQTESVCDESIKLICEEPQPVCEKFQKSVASVQIEIQPATDECANEPKDNAMLEIETEPISLETETSSIETDPHDVASSVSCNQSVKSNSSSSTRPWLRIVDTHILQQQKKIQQTFPITTAVSMWLNQVQKEKTPEPIFRMPGDNRFFSAAAAVAAIASTKYKKQDSQASHSNSSIDLTEDTASVISDRFHINDDEEEDIMNFWESPTLMTPQSPTPPPIYNSLYGSSINYANLISNKNELLCNNIIDYEAANGEQGGTHEKSHSKNGFNQNNTADAAKPGIDEKCYRPPPEVCCTIM